MELITIPFAEVRHTKVLQDLSNIQKHWLVAEFLFLPSRHQLAKKEN